MNEEFVPRSEYMERIGRSDDRMRDFDRRLAKVEEFGDKLNSMAVTMQGMLVTLQSMQNEQIRQGDRLRKMEEEPAEKWRAAVKVVITVLVTSFVTYLIMGGSN